MKPISKPQKILSVMFDLSKGQSKPLLYEDIVVSAFQRYPEDFQLRGYPQYPDSSDIHKPLYSMKQDGLVRSANKSFLLTPRGLDIARNLIGTADAQRDRLTKQEEKEVNRIVQSQAFRLFQEGQAARILDTDLYEYFGVSVRTPKSEFLGRVITVEQAIVAHRVKRKDELSDVLSKLHQWLVSRFEEEIQTRK
ncbi:MAG TPA: hypothetical protein VF345_10240 [Chthoniobacterales bacterium]